MSRLIVKVDNLGRLVKSINTLVGSSVLVGVPEQTTDDREDEGQDVTNATLAYIHENGSPANNIPPRPFMTPGVHNAKERIESSFKRAAKAALDNLPSTMKSHLNNAGLNAQSSIKEALTNGTFEPLKPETIAARKRSRKTQSRRENENQYLSLIRQGVTPADAQSQAGIKPLINTGALRDSITYVIRGK